MIKELQTSRICSACGQKKPLVAFLKSTKNKEPTYGNLCSTCRGSNHDLKQSDSDTDESSGGTTRLQIDNKTRRQLEHEKSEALKKHTELDYEEKIKKETFDETQTSVSEQREIVEKKYREAYLEKTRQTPAKTTKADPSAAPEGQTAKSFYQEKTRLTTEFHHQVQNQQVGKKTQGLTPDYINRYVSATGRSAESLFGRLLGQVLGGHYRDQKKSVKLGVSEQKPSTEIKKSQEPKAEKTLAASKEEKENIAIEFTRNNFKKR